MIAVDAFNASLFWDGGRIGPRRVSNIIAVNADRYTSMTSYIIWNNLFDIDTWGRGRAFKMTVSTWNL